MPRRKRLSARGSGEQGKRNERVSSCLVTLDSSRNLRSIQSMTNFFRDPTCGDCAWFCKAPADPHCGQCRKVTYVRDGWPFVHQETPACPGFIAKKKEAQA